MTQRLRDEIQSPDPTTARAARALRAIKPREEDVAAFDRVDARLRSARPILRRPSAWPAYLAAAVFAAVIVAWLIYRAAVRQDLMSRPPHAERIAVPGTATQPMAVPDVRVAPLAGVETMPASAPTRQAPASPAALPVTPSAHKRPSKRSIVTRPAVRVPAAERPGSPDTAATAEDAIRQRAPAQRSHDDGNLIFTARNLLYRDHYPARAAELLYHYLADHPDGHLVEEALVLAIDASILLHDGRASRLAERYLSEFPTGDHRARVLEKKKNLH
jgi:hypothetical protein